MGIITSSGEALMYKAISIQPLISGEVVIYGSLCAASVTIEGGDGGDGGDGGVGGGVSFCIGGIVSVLIMYPQIVQAFRFHPKLSLKRLLGRTPRQRR